MMLQCGCGSLHNPVATHPCQAKMEPNQESVLVEACTLVHRAMLDDLSTRFLFLKGRLVSGLVY